MSTEARIPAYRHHKARNLAVVRLNGKDYYLGPWKSTASYLEYDRLINVWTANNRNMPTPKDEKTITELIASYWIYCKDFYGDDHKRGGICARVKRIMKILRDLYGTQLGTRVRLP